MYEDKSLFGVNVAVRVEGLYVTDPFTVVAPAISVNEDTFTESGTTASLNVAVTTESIAISVAPYGGLGEPAVGADVPDPLSQAENRKRKMQRAKGKIEKPNCVLVFRCFILVSFGCLRYSSRLRSGRTETD